MDMSSTQAHAPVDLDGAMKIGSALHLLGVLCVAGGLIAAIAAAIFGDGYGFWSTVGLWLALIAAGLVGGLTLMGLGAITKTLALIARQGSERVPS